MTAAITHIIASSSDIWIQKKTGDPTHFDGLQKGQVVKATVENATSSREAVLNIQGKRVQARTHMPLKSGETLLLRVEDNGVQPTFKLMEAKGGRFIHLPPDLLSRSGPYGLLARVMQTLDTMTGIPNLNETGSQMESLIRSLSLKTENTDTDFLKSLFRGSGVTWENKLIRLLGSDRTISSGLVKDLINGDVKALSMRLALQLEKAEPSAFTQIKAFLENMEHLQLLNERSVRESGRYLLPFPFLFDETLRFGQLLIDLGRHKEDDSEDKRDRLVKVSFLLEMSNLGNVLADFSILKHALSGTFSVETDPIRKLIMENIPQLKEKMKHTGFEIYDITCRVVEPETLSTTSLADRLIHTDEGVLNIVI